MPAPTTTTLPFFGSRFAETKLDTKIPRAEREADWILQRLPAAPRVLDMGCGQGRLAIALAARGAAVTGLDINDAYLRTARERAEDLGLTVAWQQGDFLELATEECFEAVVSMFTSFGYHADADNAEIVRRVSRALAPGGVFILEVQHRDAPGIAREAVSLERLASGDEILKEYVMDLRTSVRTMKFRYLSGDTVQDGGELAVRIYDLRELTALLQEFGLTVEEVHANARGAAFTADSDHVVLVARKPGSPSRA